MNIKTLTALSTVATLSTSSAAVLLVSGEFANTAAELSATVSALDLANGITDANGLSEVRAGGNGALNEITDGLNATGTGFGNGGVNAANNPGSLSFLIDLGSSEAIGIVNIFSNGSAAGNVRQNQSFTLFGSNDPSSVVSDSSTFTSLITVNTLTDPSITGPEAGNVFGLTSVDLEGAEFQFLLLEAEAVGAAGGGESSLFSEIDVFQQIPEPSSVALLGLGSLAMAFRRRR